MVIPLSKIIDNREQYGILVLYESKEVMQMKERK